MSPFLGGAGNKIVIGAAMTLAEPESSQGAPRVCQHPSIITLKTPEKPAFPPPVTSLAHQMLELPTNESFHAGRHNHPTEPRVNFALPF